MEKYQINNYNKKMSRMTRLLTHSFAAIWLIVCTEWNRMIRLQPVTLHFLRTNDGASELKEQGGRERILRTSPLSGKMMRWKILDSSDKLLGNSFPQNSF